MTKETTPPATVPTTREPPSLPASPLAKRTKTDAMTATTPAVTSIQQPMPPLLVKKLVASAKAPTRGSAFAAGYDMYSAKETVIPAKGKAMVDTGIAIAVPEGTCMLLICLDHSMAMVAIARNKANLNIWIRWSRGSPQRSRF